MNLPRLVIAGTHSGAGKTTLSLALMAAFCRAGRAVQPFKAGPDYIDPSFHQRAAGRPGRNLDAWLMPPDALQSLFRRHAPTLEGGGLSIIEGVMGLYDGLGKSAFAGTAHIAALLKAPVVLVVNAGGLSLSAAALVAGYANFRPCDTQADLTGLRIGGVVLNGVSGEGHYALLRECIEEHTGIPCLGYLRKNAAPSLPERHLGLVTAGELPDLDLFFSRLADMAGQSLDLPALLRLAEDAPALETAGEDSFFSAVDAAGPARIGVARDAAFSFYYQDNLDILEAMGATLVTFSPLDDAALPENLDGVYLGGGFPEIFAPRLEANRSFRRELLQALENGLPAYAECGGMLYLCSSLTTGPSGKYAGARPGTYAMTGFFSEKAEMTSCLQPFGYVRATLLRDCPLGPAGTAFQAHEFHYAKLEASGSKPLLRVEKADGRNWTGGLFRRNVVAAFPHVHFYGYPQLAHSFLSACRAHRRAKAGRA